MRMRASKWDLNLLVIGQRRRYSFGSDFDKSKRRSVLALCWLWVYIHVFPLLRCGWHVLGAQIA